MNTDDFEQHLHRRPEKPIPPEWRADILRAAYAERAEVVMQQSKQRSWFTMTRLRWGALAAVWLLIAGFHFAEPSNGRSAPLASVPDSPQSQQLWREQQQLLAELLDPNPPAQPAPPPLPPPAPRSGSRNRVSQTSHFI